MGLTLVIVLFMGLSIAEEESCWNLGSNEVELKVEAEIRNGNTLTYSDATLANIDKIIRQRTRKLIAHHCGNLNYQLSHFATTHHQWGNDAYEVADNVHHLVKLQSKENPILEAFIDDALKVCKEIDVSSSDKTKSLWFLVCLVNFRAANPTHTKSVDFGFAIEQMLGDLTEMMACPQEMVHFAKAQLEHEYQQDGLVKMVEAGLITQEAMDTVRIKIDKPTRARVAEIRARKQKEKQDL
jgi:hypothetical protein